MRSTHQKENIKKKINKKIKILIEHDLHRVPKRPLNMHFKAFLKKFKEHDLKNIFEISTSKRKH